MGKFIIKVFILSGVILGLSHLLPGFKVPNLWDALIFALIFAFLNAFIAPVFIVLSFPITVMTLGLFALVINVFLFWIASLISYGIHIQTFFSVFIGGIIVAITSLILNLWLSNISNSSTQK